jgi:predicted nuclease of restriction endonuclease-like (RecB) superfamily
MNKPTANESDSISTARDTDDQDQRQHIDELISQMNPPFLIRTKTREEKESMRQEFQKQEAAKNDKTVKKGPYDFLQKVYARFSTSFMLENKAATARDHLGKKKIYIYIYIP